MIKLKYDKVRNGLFSISCGRSELRDFELVVETSDMVLRSSHADLVTCNFRETNDLYGSGIMNEYGMSWQAAGIEAVYRISTYDGKPFMTIFAEVWNRGRNDLAIKEVKLFSVGDGGVRLGNGMEDWSIYRNASMSYDQTGIYKFGNPDFCLGDVRLLQGEDAASQIKPVNDDAICIGSNYLSILRSESTGDSIAVGFYTLERQFGIIRFECSRDEDRLLIYEACCLLDGKLLAPGSSLESEKLMIYFGDGSDAIKHYSRISAEAAGVVTRDVIPTGWCSWYFYYESISERDILENLEYIDQFSLPVEYIQVDMGWEQRLGDWYPNHKFPSGMKWLADKIHSYGRKAGLWLSPFWVEPRSEVHREHPEWLLKDRHGELIQFVCHIPGYVIDTTVPEARRWIADTFKKVTGDWGFDYVKADFLRAVSLFPDVKYSGNVTRAEALRLGMEAIREGTGSGTFILACGGQYGPTLGLCNANRTGNDIGADWNSLKAAFKQNILKYWMNGCWWVNDPDCILLRGKHEGEPGSVSGYGRIKPGSFSETEAATILSLTDALGGMVFLGDNLVKLSTELIEMARSVLQPEGHTAIPMDLFSSRFPGILDSKLPDGCHKVLLVNWGDQPLARTYRLSELIGQAERHENYLIYENRSRRLMGEFKSEDIVIPDELEPHGCLGLTIKPV